MCTRGADAGDRLLAIVSKTAAFAFVFRILIVAYLQPFQMGMWLKIAGPLLLIWPGLDDCRQRGGSPADQRQAAAGLFEHRPCGICSCRWPRGISFLESTLYYLLAYLLMTIGAFAVLMIVEKNEKSGEIAAFAGLTNGPLLAVAMTVILVSWRGFR